MPGRRCGKIGKGRCVISDSNTHHWNCNTKRWPGEVIDVPCRYQLDFDLAYQCVAAEQADAVIVSFDGDFDRTDHGRQTPADVLREGDAAKS